MNGSDMSDLLSERSQKFYNGTYKWDSDGFFDEQGVHRKFSDDPVAQPPTPLPPAPLSDFSDGLQRELRYSESVSPKTFLNTSESGAGVRDLDDASGPPAADLSDREQIVDPGSRQHGGIRQAGVQHAPKHGRREAASTPVNASASTFSNPVGSSALRAKVNELKKDQGDDDDDDEDDDENRRKNSTAKNDHGEAKTKKKKKDDEDDEDDADKENEGPTANNKETTPTEAQGRKDSKATSTSGQSRKTSTVATNTAGTIANSYDTEPRTPTRTIAHPVIETPVKVRKGPPRKRALTNAVAPPAKRPTSAKKSPTKTPLTTSQYENKTKKQARETNTAGISDKESGKGAPTIRSEEAVGEDVDWIKNIGKKWVVARDKDGSLIEDYLSPVKDKDSSC